jgi:hypothetical protein
MVADGAALHDASMTNVDYHPRQTAAFLAQAMISFGVSLCALLIGILSLPADGWIRGFLTIGVLYVVTSSFTLAKCVRDQHETAQVVHRIDEARLEQFLADHDPFKPIA